MLLFQYEEVWCVRKPTQSTLGTIHQILNLATPTGSPSLPLPSLFIMMLEFKLRAATCVRQELGH